RSSAHLPVCPMEEDGAFSIIRLPERGYNHVHPRFKPYRHNFWTRQYSDLPLPFPRSVNPFSDPPIYPGGAASEVGERNRYGSFNRCRLHAGQTGPLAAVGRYLIWCHSKKPSASFYAGLSSDPLSRGLEPFNH